VLARLSSSFNGKVECGVERFVLLVVLLLLLFGVPVR